MNGGLIPRQWRLDLVSFENIFNYNGKFLIVKATFRKQYRKLRLCESIDLKYATKKVNVNKYRVVSSGNIVFSMLLEGTSVLQRAIDSVEISSSKVTHFR